MEIKERSDRSGPDLTFNMNHIFCYIAVYSLAFLFIASCTSPSIEPGFAIIIDQESYKEAQAEVEGYAAAIEADGLKTVVIIDKWGQPDSIRATLMKLYADSDHPIEGAVFIGDIPIPMIRDAQHLTSAFKMDQTRFPWQHSSVPSDRFYDDFDLQFDFIKQDSIHNNYFYYSLRADSPQRLQPEIYTGRIKPFENFDKYLNLKKYLKKVVTAKSVSNPLDKLLFFGGHGYISESLLARMDEKIMLQEQFPNSRAQQNVIGYIDHSMDEHVKDRLMSELQRDDLDMAILHHHGADDTQYLNGMPKVDNVNKQIDGVKYYLRSKMRSAKRRGRTKPEARKYYMDMLGVPAAWFEGSFDQEKITQDSLYNADLDIAIQEIGSLNTQARFIMLDACFNGAFHLDSCIASAYLFQEGNTIALHANTVNVLQDKWANELTGLLALGMSVGNWSKHVSYLESHIIGDPTFRFHANDPGNDLNIVIHQKAEEAAYWIDQLRSPLPEVQSLALFKLFELEYDGLSELLLFTFKNSRYATVRMQCLKLLSTFNDENFIECLKLACTDSNEFIQRQAIYLIGQVGSGRLLPNLVAMAMRNNTAARLAFNVKQTLSVFAKDEVLATFESMFDSLNHFTKPDKVRDAIRHSLEYNTGRWEKNASELADTTLTAKKKMFRVRLLRNYNYHPDVEAFCEFAKECDKEDLQIAMLEALGWFNLSYKKDQIIDTCHELLADNKIPKRVKNEALKTLGRLGTAWHR